MPAASPESPAPDDATRATPDIGDVIARLVSDARTGRSELGRVLARLAGALAVRARGAGVAAATGGRMIADVLIEVAPRLPVRDAAALREQYDGRVGEELADALVASAARHSAAVGAAGGALTSLQMAAPVTLVAAPLELAAETLALAAIEVKLLAELHEVYDVPVHGTGAQRATAFLQAWSVRRGADPGGGDAAPSVLGGAARRQLQRRVVTRLGRNLTTLGPLFTGAVAGGVINRRQTMKLAAAVRDDLRRQAHRQSTGPADR
ncbi:hypothetical protein BH24ACT13_BH24ACT13_16930 [soil metagenome]